MKTKTSDQLRAEHELDVLRDTVFNTTTKADTIRAAIKYAYDHVLTARLTNTSRVMGDS